MNLLGKNYLAVTLLLVSVLSLAPLATAQESQKCSPLFPTNPPKIFIHDLLARLKVEGSTLVLTPGLTESELREVRRVLNAGVTNELEPLDAPLIFKLLELLYVAEAVDYFSAVMQFLSGPRVLDLPEPGEGPSAPVHLSYLESWSKRNRDLFERILIKEMWPRLVRVAGGDHNQLNLSLDMYAKLLTLLTNRVDRLDVLASVSSSIPNEQIQAAVRYWRASFEDYGPPGGLRAVAALAMIASLRDDGPTTHHHHY